MHTARKFNFSDLNWINISVLCLTPILAIVGLIADLNYEGFQWVDLVPFFVMSACCGLSITGGYHRLFAHRAYQSSPLIRAFYLAFGAAAVENSALAWVSDHRFHHRHVDRDGDPYNINKGFFWAHMGWIFFKDSETKAALSNVADLKKDKLVLFQHRFYVPIAMIVGFGIPLAIGFMTGRPWAALVWGAAIRVVFTHHTTFLINSAAHFFGKQPYSLQNTARDSFWLAIFSAGEGYHNFHHAFPSDYRNGVAWFHWDPTKWFIRASTWVGLSNDLHVTSRESIKRAKEKVKAQLSGLPLLHDLQPGLQKSQTVESEALDSALPELASGTLG